MLMRPGWDRDPVHLVGPTAGLRRIVTDVILSSSSF